MTGLGGFGGFGGFPPPRRNGLAGLLTDGMEPQPRNLLGDLLTERLEPPRVRRVFFSFHYQRDIRRVFQVRNQWVTKPDRKAAGYFDGSLTEKAKTEGAAVVKRLINGGLAGSSVTCVLVGYQTFSRHWVRYEIFKSLEQGMGLFGVRIHGLPDMHHGVDIMGPNPFDYLALAPNLFAPEKLTPYEWNGYEWVRYEDADLIPKSAHPLLRLDQPVQLSKLFPLYDWVLGRGKDNFSTWVHWAATAAGRT
jgi:hypothetical protein